MGKTYPRVVELLRREFEDKGVTKYLFCKKTGINPTSVERYLHGISEPSQVSLEKLATYFETSVAWLRGDDEDKCWLSEEESRELVEDILLRTFRQENPRKKGESEAEYEKRVAALGEEKKVFWSNIYEEAVRMRRAKKASES
ncbi:hypothetical protein GMLC_41740 [Geomonas limicola]|uniref:HTH cro/C1-type domain-containing protein n=2 Tax=Geomonas TaxID=2651583 RepID=A0A6V8MPP3_9BACT|nr:MULTISPECIES: helix-turn-helix transcriptional regulator [Geomonas]GFO62018.1 hypothetical protein GMST_43430 [Geomonas silvestris]GFO70595.1 hypothetical protein GMLC_41740 [Geomonas limicola]